MKKILVLAIALFLVLPFGVLAEATKKTDYSTYNTLSLEEALDSEEIEKDFDEYEPASDAINIYLFRGQGCGYCKKFLTFLNSITDEYGKYFNLVSFEVWQDEANSELMSLAAEAMGEEVSGVPFIIIGDQVFPGYAEDYDERIKSAIKDLYDTDVSERFDVFEHIGEKGKKVDKKTNSNDIIVGVVTVAIIGGIVALAVVTRRKNK